MKKRILDILIVLMSISLIGIIWVQVYWIRNGIAVKEVQFDQLVNDALNDAVASIENNESLDFLQDQINNAVSDIVVDSIEGEVEDIEKEIEKIMSFDSLKGTKPQLYNISSTNNGQGMQMKVKVNGKIKTIDLGGKMEKVEQLVNQISFLSAKDEDLSFVNRIGGFVIKMVKEFKDIDKPVHLLLDDVDIDSIVQYNLKDNGIELPFSYGVLNDGHVVEQLSSSDFTMSKGTYSINLFKGSLVRAPLQLALKFKNKRNHILQSMGLMLTSSIVFTLIIMLTFGSTLYYMIKQKKLSEMKNDFINNMTHEFKTPIATISLAVDSITHPKVISDEKQIRHFSDVIKKENLRMNQQVESVLNTALGEREELEFNKKEISLQQMLEKIQERMRLYLSANKAKLDIDAIDANIRLVGDEVHLQNAICNLIDNAIKYNDNDPEISIRVSLDNEYCQIGVADNGIGMSKETQKKVFDKFYRVQKGNIHTVKGFGIGLSYVKAIVNAHNGIITLKSKPGMGSTITINIPYIK